MTVLAIYVLRGDSHALTLTKRPKVYLMWQYECYACQKQGVRVPRPRDEARESVLCVCVRGGPLCSIKVHTPRSRHRNNYT
jgi:hypothetical protein